jgi:hypothetical protein
MKIPVNPNLLGGFNHLEKYESQWEGLSHIYHILWKMKKVPNHQPVTCSIIFQHFSLFITSRVVTGFGFR